MARIRSIKPEFWTDGKIRRLNADSALFFIALWNFADDYGYFQLDSLDLSLKCPRYRPQAIQRMLRCLLDAGLIRVSHSLAVGQIVNWQHQKIKDRRASDWMNMEISWDTAFPDAPRSEKSRPRIGKDRIGEDRNSVREAEPASAPSAEPPAKANEFIAAYCRKFKERWGINPVIQGKDQGAAKQHAKKLRIDQWEEILDAYFRMPDAQAVKWKHPLTSISVKMNEILVYAKSGEFTSRRQAMQADDAVATHNLIESIRRDGI